MVLGKWDKQGKSVGNEENSKKGIIDIPNIIPNQEKGIIDIPNIIPKVIPYFIPNNPETPHKQCSLESPKHKTINYKLNNNIVNTNVFTCTKVKNDGCSDVLSGKPKYDDVLSLYNTVCFELSKVLKLSAKRKKQIDKMFCLGYSLEDFRKVFENAEKSSFLCGKSGNRSWKANFDWLIKEDNFLKVMEGNYQDFHGSCKPNKPTYDLEGYKRNYNVFDEIRFASQKKEV